MAKHNREYDVVVFGATGYTGVYASEYIVKRFPTDLKWAIAGRSAGKLEKLQESLKKLNPDRREPAIEICELDQAPVAALAKKAFILITTVGPYGTYGEIAFQACSENGTHYLDATGEIPFVSKMIKKYEAAAKKSGAKMFPQIGLESAPADLITFSLARTVRSAFAADTRDVTISLCRLSGGPSGGTLASVLSFTDNFSLAEIKESRRPFALSPIPHTSRVPPAPLLTKLTGLRSIPNLGLQTTHLASTADAGIVGRTWGLLSVIPSRKEQFYGPNFSFREYLKAQNWVKGIAVHYGIVIFGLFILGMKPFRGILHRLFHPPGQGPSREDAVGGRVEYQGVGNPDVEPGPGKQAYCRAHFNGSAYILTGVIMGEAAMTLLEDDTGLDGGVYTPACLGQKFVDRLDDAGFKFETSVIPV